MAWTYADYATQTTMTAKIARLDQHIAEVSAAVAADISSDGKSRSSQVLVTLLDQLEKKRDKYAAHPEATGVGVSGGPTVSRIVFRQTQ